jgi:hypothetical protein
MRGEKSAQIAVGDTHCPTQPVGDEVLIIDPSADGPLTDLQQVCHLQRSEKSLWLGCATTIGTAALRELVGLVDLRDLLRPLIVRRLAR